MPNELPVDLAWVASEVSLPLSQVQAAVELLDAGNTVPFVTRYRKDATGGLDETQLRELQRCLYLYRSVNEKRAAILKSLENKGQLTADLRQAVETANTLKHLEDLYFPFRQKKTSHIQQARDLGLHPLAEAVYVRGLSADDFEHEVLHAVDEQGQPIERDIVLRGVKALLGEYFAADLPLKRKLRRLAWKSGTIECQQAAATPPPTLESADELPSVSSVALATTITDAEIPELPAVAPPSTAVQAPEQGTAKRKKKKKKRRQDVVFKDYYNFSELLRKLPPHRTLAINRGDRAKKLRVRIALDEQAMLDLMWRELVVEGHPQRLLVQEAAKEHLSRSLVPSLEREIRRELTERAEEQATKVFATNLRSLLLQPPTNGQRVLAIDPGLKSGCTLGLIDEFGNFLASEKISIVGREEKRKHANEKLQRLIQEHQIGVIAIGNGAGCREVEEVVSKLLTRDLPGTNVRYIIVNEAGASVYSTSETGRSEFPDLEPTVRSAISIGRRLLDPLSELVKINPANIGVGLYQHDVKSKQLESSLDEIVESCVNYVGVDLNTASIDLLRYVAGLNQLTARRILEHRQVNGRFTNRQQLLSVPGVGQATFVQCAGFLRVYQGDQPLDATGIHPESYPVVQAVLESLNVDPTFLGSLTGSKLIGEEWAEKLNQVRPIEVAAELGVGPHLMRDLLDALGRPGRDPREQLPAPVFRSGILELDDLTIGMQLQGQVLNVVDFGIFVDIGIGESGLVHISNLAREYVRDPHQMFGVGDVVHVWVEAIDRKRRRVSLTAIDPSQANSVVAARHEQNAGTSGRRSEPQNRTGKHQRSENGHSETNNRHVRRAPRGPKQNHQAGVLQNNKQPHRPSKPKQRTQNIRPLTDGMAQGNEPLRSFSDLLQFVKLTEKNQQDH